MFNYSQDYLRNLINRKRIPATRKGKLWFVKISDIQKYIKEIERKYFME
jgi:excisionase family DNA binding protein